MNWNEFIQNKTKKNKSTTKQTKIFRNGGGSEVRNGACLEPRVILKAPEGQGCPRCGGWVYAAEQMLARGRVSSRFKIDKGKYIDLGFMKKGQTSTSFYLKSIKKFFFPKTVFSQPIPNIFFFVTKTTSNLHYIFFNLSSFSFLFLLCFVRQNKISVKKTHTNISI